MEDAWFIGVAVLFVLVVVFVLLHAGAEPVVTVAVEYDGWSVVVDARAEPGAALYVDGVKTAGTVYRGPLGGVEDWAEQVVVEVGGVNRTLKDALPGLEPGTYTIGYSSTDYSPACPGPVTIGLLALAGFLLGYMAASGRR